MVEFVLREELHVGKFRLMVDILYPGTLPEVEEIPTAMPMQKKMR